MGRRHRPFYRVCAVDSRSPRDGRVIEELGTYDPMVPETDARAILKGERIDYWLSVGAQPTPKTAVLIRKYGSNGTHLEAQQKALEKLGGRRAAAIESARQAAAATPKPKPDPEPEAAAEETASAEAAAESTEAAEATPATESTEATETAETTETADSTAAEEPAAESEAAAESEK